MEEVVRTFYHESMKSQMIESQNHSIDSSPTFAQQVETARKRLGHALNKMITAFVSERNRHPRLFRAKYTEELNLATLEDCLISAANKVFDLSAGDHSLKPARPSAKAFLDILARVQAVVSDAMESAAAAYTVRARQRKNSRRPPCLRSTFCQTSFFQPAVSPSEELAHIGGSPSTPPATPLRGDTTARGTCPDSPRHAQTDITTESMESSLPHPEVAGAPFHSSSSSPDQSPSSSPSSNVSSCLDRLPADFVDLLTELDQNMASFEFALVSAVSRRLRTLPEVSDVHEVAVLFSETIMWGLAVGLLDAGKLSDRDPMVLVSLPRLAIFVGCLLLPDSPIGQRHLTSGSPPPFMFADSVKELAYLSRQLAVLRADQLWRLACWLSPFGLSERETTSVMAAAAASASSRCNGRGSKVAPSAAKLSPNSGADPTTTTDADSGRVKTQSRQAGGVRPILWNTLGLHTIYKCISSVAGLFSTNYPTEYRDILQLAIEMNDNEEDGRSSADNTSTCTPPATPVRLQPLSPIALIESSTDSTTGSPDSSASLLEEPEARLGFIKGIDLRQLFDWNEVLFSPDRPCCRLLFEPCGQPQQPDSSPLPALSEKLPSREISRPSLKYSAEAAAASVVNKLSLEALFPTHIEEMGLDVVASLLTDGSVDSATTNQVEEEEEEEHPLDSSVSSKSTKSLELRSSQTASSASIAAASARRHPLWSLLLSSPVEGEAGETPNPAYPLPPWQPDTPARHRSISNTWVLTEVPPPPATTTSSTEDSDEGEDSETEQSRRGGCGRARWATAPVIGKECASCKATFTLIRRRHHCRRCGHIFCGSCCCHWVPVESLGSLAPVRVCKECAEFVQTGLAEVHINAASPAEQQSLLCQ